MSDPKITDYSKIIQQIEKGISIDKAQKANKDKEGNFANLLKEAINEVSKVEKNADEEIKKVVTGEEKNIHKTLIAVEKADLSFQLMMEIKNKLMDAYNELMRTRI